jgi:hypothetical protein
MSNDDPLNNPLPNGNSDDSVWSRKDTLRLLVGGFFGGLATPLILPVQEFLRSHHYPSSFSLGYWGLGFVMGIIGAVMVWLLKETDIKKALILGASLPAFFANLGGAVQNGGKIGEMQSTGIADQIASIFISSAYAQGTPSPTATPETRTVEVTRTAPFAYKVELLDSQGHVVATPREIKTNDSSEVKLALPINATTIRFSSGDAVLTKAISEKAGGTTSVTLRGEGLERKFSAQQLFGKTVELVPEHLHIDPK